MVIYTAQRARDVIGINGVFHGPTDYVVARGSTVLQSGTYTAKTGRWVFQGELSLPQATEDLDFFFETVEHVHPDPLANLSKGQYRQLKDDSRAVLVEACGAHGYVPRSLLATTAARVAAALGDGHTSCRLTSDLLDASDPYACMPPFRLKWQAGQVMIAGTIPEMEDLNGACLLGIAGKPLSEALEPVLAQVSGEREAFRMVASPGVQEIHWASARPVQGQAMTVTTCRGADSPRSVTVPLISLSRYRHEWPAPKDARSRGHHEFHHDGRTCYWRYDSFHVSEDAKKAIDAVFQDIREHDVRSLIIDLRFNGGGNSKAAEYICNYLTDKPYRCLSRIDAKISKRFLKTQRLGLLRPIAWFFQGRVVSLKMPRQRPRNMGYRFSGNLYVLIGARTFSAASDFAQVVKDHHLGTLIGEETGGVRECFGDCAGFVMPNSNLRFSVSMKRFYAPVRRPEDAVRGAIPDVPIGGDMLAPHAGAADPELEFVLDLCKRKGE